MPETATAKHTPGPWRWSDGNLIQTNHITRDVWTIPRNDADLPLIAASPDLLVACVMAEQELNHVVNVMGRSGGKYEEALIELRSAIAKATNPA